MFGSLEELFGSLPVYTLTERFSSSKGTVTMTMEIDMDRVCKAFGTRQNHTKRILDAGPQILEQITDKVKFTLQPEDARAKRSSATLPAKQAVTTLDGKWPTASNFERISKAIRDKKAYSTPEPEIPGGGGKSKTAQGQTKKPDAHSHNKHH